MKISIIIPVYNSEKYLEQCVESIRNQTHTDLEIILVDDGSTDNSPALCDTFGRQDCRVKVIHKENGGTADSRNAGMRAAEGDYITFMDNDDFWDAKEALEKLVAFIDQKKPEVVMMGRKVYWENKGITELENYPVDPEKAAQNPIKEIMATNNFAAAVWSKVIRTDFIRSNQLYFESGMRNEDSDWTVRMLLCVKHLEWYGDPYYVYRKGSAYAQTSKIPKEKELKDLERIIVTYAKSRTEGERRQAVNSYLAYLFSVWMGQVDFTDRNKLEMKKYLYLLDYQDIPSVRKVKLLVRICGYRNACRILNLYIKRTYYR